MGTSQTQEKMLQARDLIKAQKYTEARKILKTIDHPKAREWLAKIDEIELGDPFAASAPAIRPISIPQVSPEVEAARTKSYTNAAVIVLVLYFLLWLPGLIANIMYVREAHQTEKTAGQSLPGVKALEFLQVVGIVPVFVAIVLVVISLILAPSIAAINENIIRSL